MNKREGQTERQSTTKQKGDAAEDRALQHLTNQGLTLVQRNYRTPGRGGGEIDLILYDRDGTLVFVEVRQRAAVQHGGALASITPAKRARIVWAARYFLLKFRHVPPCRFDVVAFEGDRLQWIQSAFDAA